MFKSFLKAGSELTVLAAVTLWVFWGVLRNPFHLDDSLILENPQISAPGHLPDLLRTSRSRPLTYLTFYWSYRWGGNQPTGYHALNLLLHVANVALLYFFIRLLVRGRPGAARTGVRDWLPLTAAAIFALHPIQSQAVNYAYQRPTLLAGFFSLASMVSVLSSERTRYRKLSLFSAVACFVLAGTSDETALVLPLIWTAYLWAYAEGFRAFLKSLWNQRWFVLPAGLLAILGAGWALSSLKHNVGRTEGLGTWSEAYQYALSQVQVLASYLHLLVRPSNVSIEHDLRVAPVLSVYGVACALLLAAMLGSIVLVRRRLPTVAFLAVVFFLFLAPTSSIIPSADPMFEHRLYLPMIGASPLLAWGIFGFWSLLVRPEKARVAVALASLSIWIAGYAAISRQRTYIWGDNVRLWEDATAKAPRKPRAHYNLAVAYLNVDREKARVEFIKTLVLEPNYVPALYNLGWLEQSSGRLDAARRYYVFVVAMDSAHWQAHHNLGNLNVLEGRLDEARSEFQKTIRIRSGYWPAHLSLANLQLQQGDIAGASDTILRLKQLRPELLEARYLSAYALTEQKRFAEAEDELKFIFERDSGKIYQSRIALLRQRQRALGGTR